MTTHLFAVAWVLLFDWVTRTLAPQQQVDQRIGPAIPIFTTSSTGCIKPAAMVMPSPHALEPPKIV